MKILLIVKSNSACDYHRLTLPFKHMKLEVEDSVTIVGSNQELSRSQLFDCNIVMFNRLPPKSEEVIFGYANDYGYKVVVDIDDYWKLYPHHYQYHDWDELDIENRLIRAISRADMVISSTSKLADKIKEHNKKVEVVYNALPYGKDQFDSSKTPSSKVRISLTGGASHYFDIKVIQFLFEKCKSDVNIRRNAEFIMNGYNESDISIKTKNLISQCCVDNFKTVNYMPLDSYMDIYSNSDIVLAPLENNNFNTFKSNLKILEAGCKKVPILCSNVSPYSDDKVMHEKGLMLCNKTSEWYNNLKTLVNSKFMREDMGSRLYEYVTQHYNLEGWNQKRYQILKQLAT